MNIAQIKRFVNDGLVPINKLIGTPSDTEEGNSLYSEQKNAYKYRGNKR